MNRTCYSMRRNRIIILISLLLCAAAPLARSQGATGFRFGQPYYSHLFIDTVYKDSDPYTYFLRIKGKHRMHPNTEELLDKLLVMLRDEGEEKTFAYIKTLKKK